MIIRQLLVATALFAPALAAAQTADEAFPARAADVVAVFKGQKPPAEVFAPAFLAALPPEKIAAFYTQLEAIGGKVTGADEIKTLAPGIASFVLRFEKANAATVFKLEPAAPYRISELRVTGMTPADDGPAKILEEFAALPGKAGFAVLKLGDNGPAPVLTLHPDEHYAIGSAFKLWVLDAVAEEVAAKRLKWDQVVRLGPRSLPSGMVQDWPKDAPVTVETLATLMISISDNTATDTLIRLVGRDRIAARVKATGHSAPDRILPFLTTAEAFALKLGPAAARETYGKADEAAQAAQLAKLDTAAVFADPALGNLDSPVAIDTVEWLASPRDIAGVYDSLRKRSDPRVLAILGVAPGMNPEMRKAFRTVAYKGGSESGVINLSWLVQRQTGEWFVVTASWNDAGAPVDNARFQMLALRLVGLVDK